eukprot:gene11736-11881_t
MDDLGQAALDACDSLTSDTADGSSRSCSIRNEDEEATGSHIRGAVCAAAVQARMERELLPLGHAASAADNEPPRPLPGQELEMAAEFGDEDVKHFVNGMRQCLAGVLQIKGRRLLLLLVMEAALLSAVLAVPIVIAAQGGFMSHHSYASIKAAICSNSSSHTHGLPAARSGHDLINTSNTSSTGCTSSPAAQAPLAAAAATAAAGTATPHLSLSVSSWGAPGELASAVAAVFSPRATEMQAQALVGVFGAGQTAGSTEGWRKSLSSSSGSGGKAGCARRMTWTADDTHRAGSSSGQANTSPKLSPRELFQSASRSPDSTTRGPSQGNAFAGMKLDATLASINQEARHDGVLAERLAHWKSVFREKGTELSAAITAWQSRHQQAAVLSTGFLDGSHPIVDAYELGVRLQHMLRRLTALAAGANVQVPLVVLPGLFLGNAVAADSHHLLQHLKELHMLPPPPYFKVLPVALADEEEEDVFQHFYKVSTWIDGALSANGSVLVHCHEGKSRSVALLMAYLMISKGHTLAAAFQHLRSVRPAACPNAGFMNQLMLLDQQLHGVNSMAEAAAAGLLARAKPEARVCSICGAAVGLSYASLLQHTKRKHGLSTKQVKTAAPSGDGGSAASSAGAAAKTTGMAAASAVTG